MPITVEDIKVIHLDFEKEMYEPNLFEYNMEILSRATQSTEHGKASLLIRWKFETFELDSKNRFGSYVSEQPVVRDVPLQRASRTTNNRRFAIAGSRRGGNTITAPPPPLPSAAHRHHLLYTRPCTHQPPAPRAATHL